jgi:hypothetical protein
MVVFSSPVATAAIVIAVAQKKPDRKLIARPVV